MTNPSLQTLSTDRTISPSFMPSLNEFFSDTFANIGVNFHDTVDIFTHISRVKVGSLGLSWVEASPATITAKGGHVGPWATCLQDSFIMTVQETGTCFTEHNGSIIVIHPGDIVLIDPSSHFSWKATNFEPMSILTLRIPFNAFGRFRYSIQGLLGQKLSSDNKKVRLASSALIAIKNVIDSESEDDWSGSCEDLLVGIISSALLDGFSQDVSSVGRPLRQRAFALIEQKLGDPELNVSYIAMKLNASVRTIQRTFLEIGYTPRRYILERRIALAADSLENDTRSSSITDLAMSLGFSDMSYFARSFRNIMGVSASDYRNAQIHARVPQIRQ